MKTVSGFSVFLAVVAATLLGAVTPAAAQATRTWVSGVGDDANPCSRTAPCKTFAGAISKTAVNGEINCIDPGGFGAVTITKSIAIDCGGTFGSTLNAGTNGIVVNAAGIKVILRNLSIDGVGTGLNGVHVLNAAVVQLENVAIRGQTGNGVNFVPSANSVLTVSQCNIRDNGTNGVFVKPSAGMKAKVSISGSVVANNTAAGIRVNDGGSAVVSDSVVHGNGSNGVAAVSAGTAAEVLLERVVSAGNTNNGAVGNGAAAVVRMSDVTLSNNNMGLAAPVGGASLISFGNNRAIGNTAGSSAPTGLAVPF